MIAVITLVVCSIVLFLAVWLGLICMQSSHESTHESICSAFGRDYERVNHLRLFSSRMHVVVKSDDTKILNESDKFNLLCEVINGHLVGFALFLFCTTFGIAFFFTFIRGGAL